MAVGSLSERFAFIVDLNPDSAVHGLKKIGDAADKELGKSQDHLDKLGGKLQVAGAGMFAFGATALVGLGHFAKAAEEAELADLKLNNSIANSPKMAGESSQAFSELANQLQKTTVFDDEATRTMEAYLIQVGMTKDEVLQLTPAIQDLAAKGDIPLDDAAKKVTMALNGKKKGLEALVGPLDAAKYSTDKYAAVTEALGRVHGFAAEQGKTFEGQLTIVKNQLGELEEGVGVGVVQAFSKMFGVVTSVTGALDNLSPGMQAGIGEWATYGATGLVVVGMLSMLAGTLIKARDNFGALLKMVGLHTAATEANVAANEAASMSMIPLIGGLALLAGATYLASQNSDTLTVSAKQVMQATADQMVVFVNATSQFEKLGKSHEDIARALAEQSIPAAEKYAAELDRQGQLTPEVTKAIDDQKRAQIEAAAATDGVTASVEAYNTALKDLHDAIHAEMDPLFGLQNALTQNEKAQRDVTDATNGVWAATQAATDAHRQYGDSSKEATDADAKLVEAHAKLDDANMKAATSALSVTDAAQTLSKGLNDGSISAAGMKDQLAEWVAQGLLTQASAQEVADKLGIIITKSDLLDGRNINMTVTVTESVLRRADAGQNVNERGLIGFGAASGFAGTVTRPTGILTGEGGEPEDVLIVPHSKGGIGVVTGGSPGSGDTYILNNPVFNGVQDINDLMRQLQKVSKRNGGTGTIVSL